MSKDQNEIGALWEKKSAGGAKYFSGTIDGKKVVVFANRHKQNERHPDWKVLISQPRNESDMR